jgi:hypothetical protein
MFDQKNMSGSLFKNDDRAEGDNRPNAKGKCKIGNVEYYVSAWTRESASGTKYQSLAFKPVRPPDPVEPVNAREVVDDEIPF